MQAERFCGGIATDLRACSRTGERFQFAIAGNHAQGTLFREAGIC